MAGCDLSGADAVKWGLGNVSGGGGRGAWGITTALAKWPRRGWVTIAIGLALGGGNSGASEPVALGGREPGARVEFEKSGVDGGGQERVQKDVVVRPNLSFYSRADQPLTPFLDAGEFKTIWTGFVSAELRSFFFFTAEYRGNLKLEVNGRELMATNSDGALPVRSGLIRLNKGTNAFRIEYRPVRGSDGWMRVNWAERGNLASPVPRGALSHAVDPELARSETFRLGRELFAEHRCIRCHQPRAGVRLAMKELAMDAPDLSGIGSRRGRDWMAEWILNPKGQRADALMPRLFGGDQGRERAAAVAAFLAALRPAEAEGGSGKVGGGGPDVEERGKHLFEALHCGACHHQPEAVAADGKISLSHVRRKFLGDALAMFLKKPNAHFGWIRMPDFKLGDEECRSLAAYLSAHAEPVAAEAPLPDADLELRRKGEELVQRSGCLNCHHLVVENKARAKSLDEIAGIHRGGCLAERPEAEGVPLFNFSGAEAEALAMFLAGGLDSLGREDPVDFAERQSRKLRCAECHGKFEGFPGFEILGGKLRPEWSGKFISGELGYRPRPWLEARMPGFGQWGEALARGMAMEQGYGPSTPGEGPVNAELAKIGEKLVGPNGGFSCVACHAIGDVKAAQVFENPGINFMYTSERLLKEYFHRWLLNPLRVDPGTKMPGFFDEQGRSQLTEVLGGDGQRQIDAIWEYLRSPVSW